MRPGSVSLAARSRVRRSAHNGASARSVHSAASSVPSSRPWLLMDMDGTVVPTPSKAGGHYPSLAWSPCCTPLEQWLRRGGNVCVISTAGKRMWRQVHEVLKHELVAPRDGPQPGQLVLSAFSGAALFVSNPQTGELEEDVEYRKAAVEGGTCITPSDVPELESLVQARFERLFEIACEDPTFVEALSAKYVGPYSQLAKQRSALGPDAFRAKFLTLETLKATDTVFKATANAMLQTQRVPGADAVAQISMLGVPHDRCFDVFQPGDVELVKSKGLDLRPQPNSALILRHGVTKGTAIEWLMKQKERFAFDLENAVGLGDAPKTIDRPMTEFAPMPFVSVSKAPEDDLPDCAHQVRVGGEELGAAHFLMALLRYYDNMGGSGGALTRMPSIEAIRDLCVEAQLAYGGV